MNQKQSKQRGKHRHVSKNTITRNRMKLGLPSTQATLALLPKIISKGARI